MAFQLPQWFVSAAVPSPGWIRPVFDHVLNIVFATPRGDYQRDYDTGEVLLHLEITDEDRELIPLLAREGAEEIWLVLDNPDDNEPPQAICGHSRIGYLCPQCFSMEQMD